MCLDDNAFGIAVRRERITRKMSQGELAKMLNMSRTEVSRVEAGTRKLNKERREFIAQTLGISLASVGVSTSLFRAVDVIQNIAAVYWDAYFNAKLPGGADGVSSLIATIPTDQPELHTSLAVLHQLALLAYTDELKPKNALHHADKAVQYASGDKSLEAAALLRALYVFNITKNVDSVKSYANNLINLAGSVPDFIWGDALIALSIVASPKDAVQYTARAEKIARKTATEEDISQLRLRPEYALLNHAKALIDDKQYETALSKLYHADEITPLTFGRRRGLILARLAEASIGLKSKDDAEAYLASAKDIASSIDSKRLNTLIYEVTAKLV